MNIIEVSVVILSVLLIIIIILQSRLLITSISTIILRDVLNNNPSLNKAPKDKAITPILTGDVYRCFKDYKTFKKGVTYPAMINVNDEGSQLYFIDRNSEPIKVSDHNKYFAKTYCKATFIPPNEIHISLNSIYIDELKYIEFIDMFKINNIQPPKI